MRQLLSQYILTIKNHNSDNKKPSYKLGFYINGGPTWT
jgi:hypothetical protein